jgi:molybdopterin converting factor small subunit
MTWMQGQGSTMAMITIEFFGIPRQRAGCAQATLCGQTVDEALAAIEASYPNLRGLRRPDGGVAAQYLLSLNGKSFLSDPAQRLEPGSRLLLLSADAGG